LNGPSYLRIDLATPVVETIGSEAKSRFTGRSPRVTIEVYDQAISGGSQVQDVREEVALSTEGLA